MAMENVVDDYHEMADFEENPFGREWHDEDSDTEKNLDENKPNTDTTALQARNGKDIQGIPWERMNFSRDSYREMRLKQYKNFENCPHHRTELEKGLKHSIKESTFYNFQFNTRLVKSTIVHFQHQTLDESSSVELAA